MNKKRGASYITTHPHWIRQIKCLVLSKDLSNHPLIAIRQIYLFSLVRYQMLFLIIMH